MLCKYCKKNQATKTYEQIKNGNRDVTYYCLDCYQKIFLDVELDGASARTDCPYCGTTVAELKKRNLVGCAKCYEVLASQLLPVITKMQGRSWQKCDCFCAAASVSFYLRKNRAGD
jgi:protein-arginine kinase activator protein McsA